MPEAQDRDFGRFAGSELASDIEFLLARARAIGTSRANNRFANLKLKARSYALLSLAASGLNPTQKELSQFLQLDASQIVAITDELTELGLVRREAAKTDRRINVIIATEAGQKTYALAKELAEKSEVDSLQMLSADEKTKLREILAKIAF